jgi:hypothetical protein
MPIPAKVALAGLMHAVALEYVVQPSHFSVLKEPLLLR